MSKDFIESKYSDVEYHKKELQGSVDKYLQNKDNSLEDRWEVWTKYSEKKHETYYHNFPEDKFPKLTDEIVSESDKYSYKDYHDVLNSYLVLIAKELFSSKKYYSLTKEEELEVETHFKNKELMEYLMENNLGSFTIDW